MIRNHATFSLYKFHPSSAQSSLSLQLATDNVSFDQASLDAYLVSLKAVSAASSAQAMSGDQVKALFAANGDTVDLDSGVEPSNDSEIARILAASEVAAPKAIDEVDLQGVSAGIVTLGALETQVLRKLECYDLWFSFFAG